MTVHTVHLTEDQARFLVRRELLVSARLTVAAYGVWLGLGGAAALLILAMDWRAAPIGLGLGLLVMLWLLRQTGLGTQVDQRIEAARTDGSLLARPTRVELLPDGLRVDWQPGSIQVAWEAVVTEAVTGGVLVTTKGFLTPVLFVPTDHPLRAQLETRPSSGPPMAAPDGATVAATFTFAEAEYQAIRDTVGIQPRLFRRVLAVGTVLVLGAAWPLLRDLLPLGTGLLLLGLILVATAFAEPVSHWLGQRRQEPPVPAQTTMGLTPTDWFVLGHRQLTILPFRSSTVVATTDDHLVVHDFGLVVSVPKTALTDAAAFEAELRARIDQATDAPTRPGHFAGDSPEPTDNPYAPPRSQR